MLPHIETKDGIMNRSLGLKRIAGTLVGALCALPVAHASDARIKQDIRASEATALRGTVDPRAVLRFDVGREDSNMSLRGVTMHVQFTSEQKTALDALVRQQL